MSKEETSSSLQSMGQVVVVDQGDGLGLVLEKNDPLGGGLDVSIDPWLNGKFAHFLRSLGMSTKGFQEDIIYLIRKMKEKMD